MYGLDGFFLLCRFSIKSIWFSLPHNVGGSNFRFSVWGHWYFQLLPALKQAARCPCFWLLFSMSARRKLLPKCKAFRAVYRSVFGIILQSFTFIILQSCVNFLVTALCSLYAWSVLLSSRQQLSSMRSGFVSIINVSRSSMKFSSSALMLSFFCLFLTAFFFTTRLMRTLLTTVSSIGPSWYSCTAIAGCALSWCVSLPVLRSSWRP